MTQSPKPDGGRAALAGFVTNRLGRATSRPQPVRVVEPVQDTSVQSFESLPGYRELKLQRSAAELIGLANPFFHVHEVKAGATTRIEGRAFTNFSSYDYLGLNGHPRVSAAAKAAKDWATADRIRDRLADAGVQITDTPDGPEWSIAAKDVEK